MPGTLHCCFCVFFVCAKCYRLCSLLAYIIPTERKEEIIYRSVLDFHPSFPLPPWQMTTPQPQQPHRPQRRKQFPPHQITLIKGVLGGLSNVVAVTVWSPLDVLKIRYQIAGQPNSGASGPTERRLSMYRSAQHIVAHEGVRGLFKGLSISLIREMTFTSSRFGLYEPFRTLFHRRSQSSSASTSVVETSGGGGDISITTKLLAGATSGCIASALFNPTDVLKIRMQADRDGSRYGNRLRTAVTTIYRKDGGVRGFYVGASATIIRAVIMNTAQLVSYDSGKYELIRRFGMDRDSGWTHLAASIISGVVTTVANNPIDMIRTRIMNQPTTPASTPSAAVRTYRNPFQAFWLITRTEGFASLYKGFVPSYIRMGGCTAISLVMSEQLRVALGLTTI